ncbi:MAG: NACHT domain-containing protein [Ktedonobacteraceae bacterium]
MRRELEKVLTDPEQIEAVLYAARDVSGLLVARGEGVYGFLHRSFQEYFTAKHLADRPERVAENIKLHFFDPAWREPLVLAIGIVSQRRYPDSRRRLPEVFTTLLETPDPVGNVLPRHELLAAAACTGCERIPPGVGRQIGERMLAFYAEQEGWNKSPVLRERLKQAFIALHDSSNEAKAEVELALCTGMQNTNFAYRYAAVDLVIMAKWDSPAIAKALVMARCTHADPAASFLTALDEMSERHPDFFLPDFLPLRRAVTHDPMLWARINSSTEWQTVIRTLYMPPGTEWSPDRINRDSSLTPRILTAFQQSSEVDPSIILREQLISLASQPGTALGCDAALALSALGDENWISPCVMNAGQQEHLLRPPMAALLYVWAFAHEIHLALDFANRHMRGLDQIRKPEDALESARELLLDLDLARVCDIDLLLEPEREREFGPSRKFHRARDLDLAINTPDSFTFASAWESARESNPNEDLVRIHKDIFKIESALQAAQNKWATHPELIQVLSNALNSVQIIQDSVCLIPIDKVWNTLAEVWWQQQPVEFESLVKEVPVNQVTTDTLPAIIADLTSSDDAPREHARKVLLTGRKASELGQSVIEQIAANAEIHKHNHQVGTVLNWALQYIMHDELSWIAALIAQVNEPEKAIPAQILLSRIHGITPEAFAIILSVLPGAPPSTIFALLESLLWLASLEHLPEAYLTSTLEWLQAHLCEETDRDIRRKVIEILGYWPQAQEDVSKILLAWLTRPAPSSDRGALYAALARLAAHKKGLREVVESTLRAASPQPEADLALVRLRLVEAMRESKYQSHYSFSFKEKTSKNVLTRLETDLPDPFRCFIAIIDAGVDSDLWEGGFYKEGIHYWPKSYYELLVITIRIHLERHPDLLSVLLVRLQQALTEQEWPSCRIMLAAVAACTEIMPTAVRQACQGNLEALLIKGTTDTGSFNSRRFALTALSYLRVVTEDVALALLAGCQDIEEVQQDAIAAVSRFQYIEGNPIPILAGALTGESTHTAYAVAQLLGALGISAASEVAGLREQIIEALINALKDPKSQRDVKISLERKGKLVDTLYKALLQVAGWPG